jgi:hypothetical protein
MHSSNRTEHSTKQYINSHTQTTTELQPQTRVHQLVVMNVYWFEFPLWQHCSHDWQQNSTQCPPPRNSWNTHYQENLIFPSNDLSV